MDAVTFVKEKQRMCNSFGDICEKQCPLRKLCGGCLVEDLEADPLEVVSTVEQWSKEHPHITNGHKLLSELKKSGANARYTSSGLYNKYIRLELLADWWDAEYKGE